MTEIRYPEVTVELVGQHGADAPAQLQSLTSALANAVHSARKVAA